MDSEVEIDFAAAELSWVAFAGGVSLQGVKLGDRPGRHIVTEWQKRLAIAKAAMGEGGNARAWSLLDNWAKDASQDEFLLLEADILEHCGRQAGSDLISMLVE